MESYLRVPEVAEVLGVSRVRAYEMVRDGTIPSIRLSERRIRIPIRAWEAYMEAREREALENLGGPDG